MGKRELEELLAQHCAPTLAGLKAASMVAVPTEGAADLWELLRGYRQCFELKGLRALELRRQKQHVLLLLYRPAVLRRLLRRPLAQEILRENGYRLGSDLEELLQQLCTRMQGLESFPHEIGIFLGYPPCDVAGFIRCKGKDFRMCGFWKVYGNEKAVHRLFQCYDCCIKRFCASLRAGVYRR